MFREALKDGGCEAYFGLAEQFNTQGEPAYCGLGSFCMVMNALNIEDRSKVLKTKNVKHLTEESLDLHIPLEIVREKGVTFDEFKCLAELNGAFVVGKRAEDATYDEFLQDIHRVTSVPHTPDVKQTALVATYSRRYLGQTGDGHFSPLAAFHRRRSACLILDTARFKYPPYWVDSKLLFESMRENDSETGKSRGWFLLQRNTTPSVSRMVRTRAVSWEETRLMVYHVVPEALAAGDERRGETTCLDVAGDILQAIAARGAFARSLLETHERGSMSADEATAFAELAHGIEGTEAFRCVGELALDARVWPSRYLAALLVAAWPVPPADKVRLPAAVRAALPGLQTVLVPSPASPEYASAVAAANEVTGMRERLSVMAGTLCSCDMNAPAAA
eukprot:gene14789-22639_t